MQIFIQGISLQKNSNIQTINDLKKTDSTRSLYVILNNMFRIESEQYYLYKNTKILPVSDETTLKDYNIGKESTIQIHFRMGNAGPCKINPDKK